MKIIIEMPEPRNPECELCGGIHQPKEVCEKELSGIYMTPAWMKETDILEEIEDANS